MLTVAVMTPLESMPAEITFSASPGLAKASEAGSAEWTAFLFGKEPGAEPAVKREIATSANKAMNTI
jgi:hypothetical protein